MKLAAVIVPVCIAVASCGQVGSVGSLLVNGSFDAGTETDAGAFPCGTPPFGPPTTLPEVPGGGRSFYVSPTGDDANDGSSPERPFRTLQHAADRTAPGDTVFAMSGTFATDGIALDIKTSGTPSAWITYRAMPGARPVIRYGSAGGIRGRGISYVVIDGFEIEGNSREVTEAYANAADPLDPITNSTGIEVAVDDAMRPAHHVVVRNNVVYHASAAGISMWGVDHVTIAHNVVYGNSRWSKYAASGISVGQPIDVDTETGPKVSISGNLVYDNVELVPAFFYSPPKIINGNGIIVYDTAHQNDERPDLEYKGRIAVTGNVAYENGGPGIHLYRAKRVDVAFNTLYRNGLTVSIGQGQLDTNECDDVAVRGNILFGHDDQVINLSTNDGRVVYEQNIYFRYTGAPALSGPGDLTADPRLSNPSCLDFRLLPDSPALDSGPASLGDVTSTDILGAARPAGQAMDRGAYERGP